VTHRETLKSIEAELLELEAEIGRQRLIRERAPYKLSRLLREQDRLAGRLVSIVLGDGCGVMEAKEGAGAYT
jgi:hypothetical protein